MSAAASTIVGKIRDRASTSVIKTIPNDQAKKWAIAAIALGVPARVTIEAGAKAIGEQLAELAFVTATPETTLDEITYLATEAMREHFNFLFAGKLVQS